MAIRFIRFWAWLWEGIGWIVGCDETPLAISTAATYQARWNGKEWIVEAAQNNGN